MFLKTEILKAISFRNPVKLPLSYWLLVALRFGLTLLPQRGYIHPDEFFQNVEVVAGDVFMVDVARTWEFNPKFPIRNIFIPKMILGPPLQFIHLANQYSKMYLNIDLRSPYYLLVIPRLFICFLSLINDYCLYKICVLYGQNFRNRLKVFATSYVVFVYCCRSFSNSFEMIFFSVLLWLVAECMFKSDKVIYHDEFLKEKYQQAKSAVEKVKLYKMSTHLPEHSLNHVLFLSTLVIIGIFNRPTFVGFAFSPIFFWLHRGLGSKVIGFKDFHYRIFMLVLCSIPTILLLIIIDSCYYGYLTLADIESFKLTWDNWVVTPLNFLRYNSDMGNLTQHGLHPRWLHLAVNVPLLFNVLGILAVFTLAGHIYRNPVKLPLSYWLLVALRFGLTLLPQRGYIHPDEFFQNVEVVAGDVFMVDVARTWEFNPKFPIRNIFIPKMILGPPLQFIHLANQYSKMYLNIDLRSPYYLLVIPRLFICFLSLINDYCLYKICVLYGQNFRNRLKVFATSYVVFVYCCRSFSNSFEMIFFSVLLWLVAECMFKSDKVIYHDEFLKEKYQQAKSAVEKVKLYKMSTHLPEHSLNHVLFLSTLVIIGIFNRPTFVGFAFSPIFFWLHRGLGSKVIGFKDFHYRIFMLVLCSIPTILLLIIIDSCYYGYLTLADIESFKLTWDNWVVTPLNFLRYNSDMGNLTQHGLHPRWLHLAVNVPLLFNVLGILAVFTLAGHIYRFIRGQYSKLPRIQSITGLMLFSLITPVAVLSLFPHQEARFIIPILLPLVYLFGNHLHVNESDGPHQRRFKNFLRGSWYIINIILVVFFGFVHQGGIYPFANTLHREIKQSYGVHTHVITTHSYSIPTFLLQLDSTTRVWRDRNTGHKYRLAPTTFLYKYGSMPMDELFTKIDEVLTEAEMMLHNYKKKYRFYIASPCSLERRILDTASSYYYINVAEEFSYFPHFCTEALPSFPSSRDQFCVKNNLLRTNESRAIGLNMYQRISCFLERFCLKIYRVSPKDHRK